VSFVFARPSSTMVTSRPNDSNGDSVPILALTDPLENPYYLHPTGNIVAPLVTTVLNRKNYIIAGPDLCRR
jgi:hypothetical protein